MIINTISLCDFRVFRGRHSFDLAPRVKHRRRKPVILFGGLNGAGKTTLLMAVRLVLYGPQALGQSLTKKAYEEFLKNCIHRSPTSVVQASNSWIEMSFDYSRDAETQTYCVRRSWSKTGRGVKEHLTISDPNNQAKGLSTEQTQAFLSELIPIGLSELFFFDGEKVADLAEDQTGKVLQHAFRKLMGLDVIERLKFDLATLIRDQMRQGTPIDLGQEISDLETQLDSLSSQKQTLLESNEELKKQFVAVTADINQLQRDLEESGGIWAQTQKQDQQRKAELLAREVAEEATLRQLLSDTAPLLIVRSKIRKLARALEEDHEKRQQYVLVQTTGVRLNKLRRRLSKLIAKEDIETAIKATFGDLQALDPITLKAPFADVTPGQVEALKHLSKNILPATTKQLTAAQKELDKISTELEEIESRLLRAPQNDSTIQEQLDTIREFSERRGDLKRQLISGLEQTRQLLSTEKDLIYQLRRAAAKADVSNKDLKVDKRAAGARELLDDFAKTSTKKRLSELEDNFAASLQRLNRKDDLIKRVEIEPETLNTMLYDVKGQRIAKSDLSAGERQIYALAILEALTKTSGRRLPVIIDTPLGRLDSKHRKNLVDRYFPTASHQVIILSTDTEVDEKFFGELSPHISHAYELDFDSAEKCTFAREGYFWKKREHEKAA
jgi:DNA sulfur modification protein DndD